MFGLEGNPCDFNVCVLRSNISSTELDTFATDPTGATMWRGFVASAVAAVALQYIDPFGVGKLVLFQASPSLCLLWLLTH